MSASTPTPTPAATPAATDDSCPKSLGPCPPGTNPRDIGANVALCARTESKRAHAQCEEEAQAERKDPPAKEEMLWYFAIGSMMNPTSMNLRNLHPKKSMPGILRDYKLVFRGGGGMGDVDPEPGASFHGVLHLLTPAEFTHLDAIEAIYDRLPVKVETYDGGSVDALAYKMDQTRMDKIPDALPGERYLDIIARGAVHYGVDPAYVETLRQIPVQPRKKVSEYRKVPLPPPAARVSKERLAAGLASEGQELLISINGKVLKFATDPASSPLVARWYEWNKHRYAGTEIAANIAKTLYEPLYPIPTTYEEMLPAMRAWAEELFLGFASQTVLQKDKEEEKTNPYRMGNWEIIGWLEGSIGLAEALKSGAAKPAPGEDNAEQPTTNGADGANGTNGTTAHL